MATTQQRQTLDGDARFLLSDARRRSVPSWGPTSSMRIPLTMICVGLFVTSSALAIPPPGNVTQLQQLNRSSAATLRDIQHPSGPPRTVRNQPDAQKHLDRRQQSEQRLLQDRQRRQLLMLNNRSRTSARPGVPYSLQGINLQRRFQLQQQNQLNRFRLQRGSPLR